MKLGFSKKTETASLKKLGRRLPRLGAPARLRRFDGSDTAAGRQAARAGQLLKARGFGFDVGFTSVLQRATRTLVIVLAELGLGGIPVEESWRLNERFYGALQGLNKAITAARYGAA